MQGSILRYYGDCAFCVAGTGLWNGSPEKVKGAKSLATSKSLAKETPFKSSLFIIRLNDFIVERLCVGLLARAL